jgi:Na+-translocating ferredoxin:NAD+ oxidoreductase RnfE subunit
MHTEQPWWQSLLSFLISIGCIVYGIKAFKADNGGFLSLGEALKTGLGVALVAGILGSLFTLLFITVIEPDFATQMMEVSRDKMIESNPNMTDEQMDMAISIQEKMMSPGILFAISIISTLFIGFIISLIAGLIMKVNKPTQM